MSKVRPAVVATALVFLLAPAACTPAAPPVSDEALGAVSDEVTAAVASLTAAMNAHDGDAVMAFYGDGPDFVYLGCTEYILGSTTFKGMAAPYYPANPDVVFEQEVVSVRVLGPDAAVVSLRGGEAGGPALFWTQVWERDAAGEWLVSVEHESWAACPEPSGPHPLTSGEETR